jgi:uncharacterized protein
MKMFLPLWMVLISGIQSNLLAQVHEKLIHQSFHTFHYHQKSSRAILSMKDKSLLAKLNPVTYVSAGLLFFYQRVISEQLQAECSYEISCSEFTKLGLQKQGLKGFFIGIDQWSNCMPKVIEDYPRHRISSNDKIINNLEK